MSDAAPRQLSTVERAYELARSGNCRTIDDIRRKLSAERYEFGPGASERRVDQARPDRFVQGGHRSAVTPVQAASAASAASVSSIHPPPSTRSPA